MKALREIGIKYWLCLASLVIAWGTMIFIDEFETLWFVAWNSFFTLVFIDLTIYSIISYEEDKGNGR